MTLCIKALMTYKKTFYEHSLYQRIHDNNSTLQRPEPLFKHLQYIILHRAEDSLNLGPLEDSNLKIKALSVSNA
jgi:hypothetical protein